ncbi:MAG TPA: peptide ABC transporter substrate-binding protein [Herpetosiphonaceae bacterium]
MSLAILSILILAACNDRFAPSGQPTQPRQSSQHAEFLPNKVQSASLPQACLQAATTAQPLPPDTPTLRIGLSAAIPNTLLASAPWPSTRFIAGAVHRGLVAEDQQGNLIPMLAEGVPTLENGGAHFVRHSQSGKQQLVVMFRLRDHLRWSDGQPLTSADVKFTYELLQHDDATYRGLVESIERIDTPDARTVVITYLPELQPLRYNQPFAGMLYPAHALKGLTPGEIEAGLCALRPVSAGPYAVREWRYVGDERNPPMPGVIRMSAAESGPMLQQITLEANPNFAGTQPRIGRVVIEVIPDRQLLLERLRQGHLDMLADRAIETVDAEVQQAIDRGFTLDHAFEQRWERLDFNMLAGPATNALVRQAIAHAIDRQAIVEAVFGERGRVMQSWIPQDSWAYLPVLDRYRYDPARARALLIQAGYAPDAEGFAARDGKRLRLVMYYAQDGELRQRVATMIQTYLTDSGIEIDLRPAPRGAILGALGILEQHRFDLVMFGWQGSSDPDGFSLWHSSRIPQNDNNWLGHNYAGWHSAENDSLLDRLAAPTSRQEQTALYQQQQQRFAADLPSLSLFEYPRLALRQPALHGVKLPLGSIPITWNIEAWERR